MTREDEPRDTAAVRIFPPLVPILVILAGIGLSRLWPVELGLEGLRPLFSWAGGGVIVLGLALAAWAELSFLRSRQSALPWTATESVITRGPFRFTRNPMYLMMVALCLGFALRRMDVWMLLLTPLAAWLLRTFAILPEEAYLERKFGASYLAYKARVRRWL